MSKYLTSLNILGLSTNASLSEVKSAYRAKAKQLHPDVNPSAKAQDQFLRLTRAYEYILAYKANNATVKDRSSADNQDFPGDSKKYGTHTNRNSEANRIHREKARERAQQRKEAYVKSDEYKNSLIFERFFDYFALILIFIMAVAIVILPFKFGVGGTIMSVVTLVVAFPLWWAYVRKQFKSLSFSGFLVSYHEVRHTYLFWVGTLLVTNIFLFLYCTINTVISSNFILILFILSIVATKTLTKHYFKYSIVKQNYWTAGVIPFVINLVFLFNYVLSFDSVATTYEYKFSPYSGKKSFTEDGLIFLPEDTFRDEYFIRIFFNRDIENASQITFVTATGILGMDVVQDYHLSGARFE